MADYDELNGLENGHTEPEAAEHTAPVTEAQPQYTAPEQTPYAAPAQQRPMNEYDPNEYTAPRRGAYADAGYIPASDAGAMPRSYHCAAQTERRTKTEKRPRRGMHPAAVIALCLVCAILGGIAAGYAPRLLAKTDAPAVEAAAPDRSAPASGTTDSTILTVSNGGTVTYSETQSGAYSATNPTYTDAGTYAVYYKVEKDGYHDATGSANVTISKKSVTVSGLTAAEKTYDGTATAELVASGAVFEGLLSGDSLSVAGTPRSPTPTRATARQ